MNLHCAGRIALAGLTTALCLAAQDRISVGVTGGIPLTDSFANRSFSYIVATIPNLFGPPFIITQTTQGYTGSKNFVLGPTLEIRLPSGFAVEGDALYRPMNLMMFDAGFGRQQFSTTINSWEFPVLAKYRFRGGRINPHVEAGPSFRAISQSPAQHMSGTGVTAGIGIELRIGPLRIGPGVRYTHWGADGAYNMPFHAVSNRNQVEFLAQLLTGARSSSAVAHSSSWTEHVAIGLKGGLPFTNAFLNDEVVKALVPSGNFSSTTGSEFVQTSKASRNYLVGPMLEIYLPRHISLEADALYAPVSYAQIGSSGIPGLNLALPSLQTLRSWQVPVVGKYRFSEHRLSPYLEAGPTFREVSAPLNRYISNSGVTAGVGVDVRLWKLRIAPGVRYLHWGKDAPDADLSFASRRNQAQFLLGLSY